MSEVGLLFPPYQQRSRLQSNTYQAITHLFTLFHQHKQSLNNNFVFPEEPTKKDSDNEEGQISDSGDVDDDKDVMEAESGERNLEQEEKKLEEAKKRCTGTYEKFMLSILSSPGANAATEGRAVPENAVAKTSSSAYSMNSVVQAEASGGKKEKRKRGAMTQGRKEKRRKQRAEQDKQNGVKRLKLEIVTKPKTVHYCKYFLGGKCQRGDACKFSHDTIPLTKSKACHHHARGNCLKGDDCPYDHDLSKYPCDNYKNKGFCGRGDSCLFSHKIAVVDDEASQVTSDVNGIGGQEISSLGKEQNKGCPSQQMLNRSKNRTLKAPGNLGSNVRQPPPPTEKPQGINSLSVPSTPSADSNNRLKRKLPVAMGNDTVVGNVNNGVVEKFQNGNEMLGRKPIPPPQPPKGISFLTCKSIPSTNSNNQQNRQLPVAGVNGGEVGSINNGAAEKNQNTNEMLGRKPTTPSQPPKGLTFLSFQRTPSTMQNSEVPVVQENGVAKKFQNRNDSGRKPPSTCPSSQSSKMVAKEQDKHTSNPWASKASSSTSCSTYDSKLTNSSIQTPTSNGNIPTISSILQEFLFNGQ